MRFQVTISKTGSFTVPVAVRKALGIKPGQQALHSIKDNKLVIEFVPQPKESESQKEQKAK